MLVITLKPITMKNNTVKTVLTIVKYLATALLGFFGGNAVM